MRRAGAMLVLAALALPALPGAGRAEASGARGISALPSLLEGRLSAFSGGAGIVVDDPLKRQTIYAHAADEVVITASLYKLGVLLEAEKRVEAGVLRYTDEITIEPEDITADGSDEPAGTVLTVDAALEKMITVSDNGTAMAFVHVFGADTVNATLAQFGVTPFHVAVNDSEDNTATPRAVATFFDLLARHQLVSKAASDRMLARLERQQINDRIPAQLPEGTVVAHKTGNLGFVTHDAGIVYGRAGDPYVVVAMTWDSSEPEAVELIQDVASLVYANALVAPTNVGFAVPEQAVATDAGRNLLQMVRVVNLGPRDWSIGDSDPISLVWEMRDAAGRVVAHDVTPILVPNLRANAAAELPIVLTVPPRAGDYRVTIGLADKTYGELAQYGVATESFVISAHLPFLAAVKAQVPSLLHRGEASAVAATIHPLDLLDASRPMDVGWRVIEPRNGRVMGQGITPFGIVPPRDDVSVFTYLVAPQVLGTYTLELFPVSNGQLVGPTTRQTVVITGPRTYGDELGEGRAYPSHAPIRRPLVPSPLPLPKLPVP